MSRRSLADCIIDLKAAGELSDDEARKLMETYEGFERQYRMDLGDEAAAAKAAADTVAKAQAEATMARRAASMQAAVSERIKRDIFDYRDKNGEMNVFEAIEMHYSGRARGGRIVSLEFGAKAIDGHFNYILGDFMRVFERQKITGSYAFAAANLDNIGREITGQQTGDASAKIMAQGWTGLTDHIHGRYTAAGGVMHKLANYLPQWHDPRALRGVPEEQWRDYIFDRLGRGKMIDYATGKPLTDSELNALLKDMRNRVVTEGWYDREPARREFGMGALWKRRAEQRHLHFRDYDAWKEYAEAFGDGDPLASLVRYKEVMARDIATMEIFGPSADATHEWLKQLALQQGLLAAAGKPAMLPAEMIGQEGTRNLAQRIAGDGGRLDSQWSILRGHSSVPVSTGWASTFHVARGVHLAGSMGMAVWSAAGDVGSAEFSRKFAGVHGSQLVDILKQFSMTTRPAEESKRIAAAAGLSIDSAAHMLHRQAREVKASDARYYSDLVSDRVLGLSGLTPWTVVGQHLAHAAFFAEANLARHETYDQLSPAFRDFLGRNGLTRGDWNIMRASKPGADQEHWLRPADIFRIEGKPLEDAKGRYLLQGANEEVATRMARREIDAIGERWALAVLSDGEFAVPTSSVKTRAMLLQTTRPGTIPGDLARNFGQYRMWPIMTTIQWVDRIGSEWAKNPSRAAGFGVGLAVTLSGIGVLSTQMREILEGRDFLDMNDWRTYARGILRGGGLGIVGDLAFSDYNRYGASFGATLAGPVAGTIDMFAKTIQKAGKRALEGEETSLLHDLARNVWRTVPGNNLWYLKLAGQRLILDNLQRQIDPDADKAFRRAIRRIERETGQESYWPPGESLPLRAPGLTTDQ